MAADRRRARRPWHVGRLYRTWPIASRTWRQSSPSPNSSGTEPTTGSSSCPATISDRVTRRTSACTSALHEGVATCASLMVPAPWACQAANNALDGRRHRRPPDPQRRARLLPMGADHARPVAAVRGGRFPPHARRPVGARGPQRGAARAARPGRTGARLGTSTSPTSPRTCRPSRCAPSSSTSTSNSPPSSSSRSACRRRSRPSRPGSRSASWRAKRGCCSPTTSITTGGRAAPSVSTTRSNTCNPGSPRSTSSRRSTRLEVRAVSEAADGWIADLDLVTSDELRTRLADSGAIMIGYRALRTAMRANSTDA